MSIFISILLVYAIFILRDVNKASESVRESAERINALIIKPIKMAHELIKYTKPVVDLVEQHIKKKETKKKSDSKKP